MFSSSTLSQKQFFTRLCIIALAAMVALIGSIESRTHFRAKHDTKLYADLLSKSLWEKDTETARELSELICHDSPFVRISLTHAESGPFTHYSSHATQDALRAFLRSIHGIRDIPQQLEVKHHGTRIGSIEAHFENTNIFTYLYCALTLMLAVFALTLMRSGKRNQQHSQELEHDLHENTERLHSVVESSPIIAFTLSEQGHILTCEGMGMLKMKLNSHEIIGQPIENLHQALPILLNDFHRVLQGESFSAIRTTADRTYETWFSPLHENDTICGVMAVATDVTAALHAMQSLDAHQATQSNDLHIARQMLHALLPHSAVIHTGYELGMKLQTADSIGGNYLHFSNGTNPSHQTLTFAKIAGHGVEAALLTSIFHINCLQFLRPHARSIADDFHKLNSHLHKIFPEGKHASTFHAILTEEHIRYAEAASTPALILRSNGAVESLQKSGPSLGLLPPDLLPADAYREKTVQLVNDDLFILHCAGLLEIENAAGKTLTQQDIIQWIEHDRALSAQHIVDSLYRKAISHTGGCELLEDITIVVLKKLKK